jgi:hypothetical protein
MQNNTINNQLDHLLTNKDWLSNIRGLFSLFNNSLFRSISYLGVNFSDAGVLSLKIYIVTSQKVAYENIHKYFPLIDHVKDKYESHKGNDQFGVDNIGVCFSIKVSNVGELNYTYFQSLDNFSNTEDQSLKFLEKENPIRNNLFVLESNKGELYNKEYNLYLTTKNMTSLLKYFNLYNIDANLLNSVEYAYFHNIKKINILPKTNDYLIQIATNLHPKMLEVIDYFSNRYNLYPNFPGVYFNSDIKSIYFTTKPCNVSIFDNESIQDIFSL